jgi:septal ring factor EnvC (AmiA/AmiB activator)
VILDHGSSNFTLYGNLAAIDVSRGRRVNQGETVGSVGASLAGPPALYFELRIDGQPVDPLQWLKRR